MPRGGACLLQAYRGELPYAAVQNLVATLREDGLCVLPAGAHYTVVCCLSRPKAIDRFLSLRGVAKQREYGGVVNPQAPPIVLLCDGLPQAARYMRLSDGAFAFMRIGTPGVDIFVLPTKSSFPKSIGKWKSAAVCIPSHALPRVVARELDAPLLGVAVPHAAEEPEYALDASLIHERWAHLVDMVVDDGVLEPQSGRWFDCTGSAEPVLFS